MGFLFPLGEWNRGVDVMEFWMDVLQDRFLQIAAVASPGAMHVELKLIRFRLVR